MNKFKITVETKSRSKVVSILESALSKAEFQNDLFNIFSNTTIKVGDTVFNASNVNYIQAEEVE